MIIFIKNSCLLLLLLEAWLMKVVRLNSKVAGNKTKTMS